MAVTPTWATAVVLHSTPAYGGTGAVLAADQQYDLTADVDLETAGQNGAQVLVEAKRTFTPSIGGQPANGLIVDVFASLDGSVYDTRPFASHRIEMRDDIEQASFTVANLAHFRLGVKTTGTSGTFDYRITHQRYI